MKLLGAFRRWAQRFFFRRNWDTISRVASRAMDSPTHTTLMSEPECKAMKDFCYEYARRVGKPIDMEPKP